MILEDFKELADRVTEINLRADERIKTNHERFNVFTTLLSSHDEVRLHTRFICLLLDPLGQHDCGDLFLKLFLQTLEDCPPLSVMEPTSLNTSGAYEAIGWESYLKNTLRLEKETRKDQGQLDILLESDSHALVIENKIYAAEQANQVARYVDYVDSLNEKVGAVLYLTLDGKKSKTNDDKPYLCISYEKHILHWLELCLKATYNIIGINQTIIQYKSVIKQLTGNQMNEQDLAYVKTYIAAHPQIVANNEIIKRAIQELSDASKAELPAAVENHLNPKYKSKLRPKMVKAGFAGDDFAGLVISLSQNNFLDNHDFEIWLETDHWNILTIGIENKWLKKDHPPLADLERIELIRQGLHDEFSSQGYSYIKPSHSFDGTSYPIGRYIIKETFLGDIEYNAQMMNKKFYQGQIKEITASIESFMKILENEYRKVIIIDQT